MARPRKFDANVVLEKAMEAFWTKGYEATSMADLMKAMGLNKGSIYAAFGNKHSLFTKALTQYTDTTYVRINDIFTNEKSPKDTLKEFFDEMLVERSATRDKVEAGSLMVNSIIELAPHDEAVKCIIDRQVNRLEATYAKTIALGQKMGEIRKDICANELAIDVSVFVFGVMSYRKTGCNETKIKMITDNYLRTLSAQIN